MTKNFTGKKNYMKRAFSDSVSIAAPSSLGSWGTYVSSYTITHNLGYIPQVRVYYENSATDGKVYPAGGRRVSGLYPGLAANSVFCTWELDDNDLTIHLESMTSKTGNRRIYWVIYLDYENVS